VAKLTAPVNISGYGFHMYGGDREHPPRHFHILCDDEWEIKIFFRTSVLRSEIVFEVKWPVSMRDTDKCPLKKNQRKRLLALLIEHLDALDAQWEALNPDKE
jgi:hypothetical protein